MRNFKSIIMLEYTSKLTILRNFLKILSMKHICPINPKLAATVALFLCKKLIFQLKIYTQTRVSCSMYSKFSRGNIYSP